MRNIINSTIIAVLIVALGLIGCKKDCPLDTPTKRLPKFFIDSAIKCKPVLDSLTTNEFTFVNFLFGDTIRYYKNSSNIELFQRMNILHDTLVGSCYIKYEYFGSGYYSSSMISSISFSLFPYSEIHFPENFSIHIGPSGQFGCESIFKISTENDLPDMDSVQILNKTFYNVYYRTMPTFCCTEMYYNKQYGIVGFNWNYEWYALETDSL